MPRIKYEDWSPHAGTLALVETANEIIAEYEAQGFNLTLRQLYYQFVSRDVIPNRQAEYKRLGDIVSKARRAGLIDWDAIVDRTRELRRLNSWDSPEDILSAVAQQFRFDPWKEQSAYVEVWFEKDALMGVFERPANEWRIPFFSCRGYTSDSEVWAAAQRLAARGPLRGALRTGGKRCIVLHFGDHDPSGLDMSRDIEARLALFGAGDVEVRRIALNMDQVRKYSPPPNPAKDTDSRFEGYQAQYGDESWELDALDPATLAALVEGEVKKVLNVPAWKKSMAAEDVERGRLDLLVKRYQDVVEYLGEDR